MSNYPSSAPRHAVSGTKRAPGPQREPLAASGRRRPRLAPAEEMMIRFVGLDVHKRMVTAAIFDAHGGLLAETQVRRWRQRR